MIVYHAKRKPVFKNGVMIRRFGPSFTVGFELVENVDGETNLFIAWSLPESNYSKVFGRQTVENRLMRMVKFFSTRNKTTGDFDDIGGCVAQSISKNIEYYVEKALNYYKIREQDIKNYVVYHTGHTSYMVTIKNEVYKGECYA
jgi:hypothetical protein